jgi:hypothetical protein
MVLHNPVRRNIRECAPCRNLSTRLKAAEESPVTIKNVDQENSCISFSSFDLSIDKGGKKMAD